LSLASTSAAESKTKMAAMTFFIFRRSFQISHARRAGKPTPLNDWAMLSGDDISESGESKGVAAVAAGSASSPPHICIVIAYKPHGVIDFNRPDLLLRELRKRLRGPIWLDELDGWHGEGEAFLELRMESEVIFFSDQPWPKRVLPNVSSQTRLGAAQSLSVMLWIGSPSHWWWIQRSLKYIASLLFSEPIDDAGDAILRSRIAVPIAVHF
jgi:hypothetical protein